MEDGKTSPGRAGPVVLQVVRDTTYGQVRHIENLEMVPGVRNIVAAPGEASAALPRSFVVPTELPRRPSPKTFAVARELAAAVRPLRPDLVHSHSVATLPASAAVARALGVPLVHSPHALPVSGLSGSRVEVEVAKSLVRLAARAGATLVAVSAGEQATLRRLVGRHAPLELVLNPVPARYLGEQAMPRDPWLVLSLSRFWPQKSPALTLEAFAELKRIVPGARLAWAGDGPLLEPSRQLAERLGVAGYVEFLGAVPDPLPWLQRASALLSSSSFEAMPYSILESMAAGALVVATDIPAHREIDAGAGALSLCPAEAHSLAAALGRALLDGTEGAKQRVVAREVVARRHSPTVFAHTMADFYARLTRSQGANWLLREAA